MVNIINVIIYLLFILALLAGGIWLQIFLSRKNNRWLGLIIPFVCFTFSIVAVLSLAMYSETKNITVTEITDSANAAVETTVLDTEKPGMLSMLVTALPVFFITNIPTIIFLVIYFACREKIKLRAELDKMNIQDLE